MHQGRGAGRTLAEVSWKPLLAISTLACLALGSAQGAALLEFLLIPAPTSDTIGPQGPLDEALGLLAGLGGVVGILLAAASGVIGLSLAGAQGATGWRTAILGSAVIAVLALMIAAFILLSLPRNPVHPFSAFIVIPGVTLWYAIVAAGRSRRAP